MVICLDKYKDNGILHILEDIVEYNPKVVEELGKDKELYNAVYKDICEIAGIDAMYKIYLNFKGQQISFPVRLYRSDMVGDYIAREYNGKNIKELAKKYNYSEKSIRRMIKTAKEKSEKGATE